MLRRDAQLSGITAGSDVDQGLLGRRDVLGADLPRGPADHREVAQRDPPRTEGLIHRGKVMELPGHVHHLRRLARMHTQLVSKPRLDRAILVQLVPLQRIELPDTMHKLSLQPSDLPMQSAYPLPQLPSPPHARILPPTTDISRDLRWQRNSLEPPNRGPTIYPTKQQVDRVMSNGYAQATRSTRRAREAREGARGAREYEGALEAP